MVADWNAVWREDKKARAPFIESEPITEPIGHWTSYSGNIFIDPETIIAVRYSFSCSYELVRMNVATGEIKVLGPVSPYASRLAFDSASGLVYYSETLPDLRWSLRNYSAIRALDPQSGKSYLLKETRDGYFYNPSVLKDGTLAAVRYYPSGKETISLLDK